MADVYIVYLPSPPRMNVFRDWAGGYGTALPSERAYAGHDQKYFDVPYLQFLYIARVLQDRGISVAYENLQNNEQFLLPEFLQRLKEAQPKILLTNLSLPSFEHDLQLLKTIREAYPITIVLVGGIAKLFHERVLQEGYADFILMQDEELVAPAVIQEILVGKTTPLGTWHLENGQVSGTPSETVMADLNFVDFPAYELVDFAHYQSSYPFNKLMRYMTLLTSKGCPYPCAYCPYPFGFGKKVLYRNPELVLADIEKLVKDYQREFLVFRDQLLTLNRAHCEAILHGMIDRKLNVIWLCETRYDLVDKDLLRLMYQAGCREINYGLETGDETLFSSEGKAKGKGGLDVFGRVIQETKAAGITCHTHLILGLPNDSWASIKNTVRFLKKYQPDSAQTAIFIPYPGTPLGEQLDREGKITNKNYQDYTGFKAVIPTKYMSTQDIEKAKAYIGTVWNRSIPTRIIQKLQSWVSAI